MFVDLFPVGAYELPNPLPRMSVAPKPLDVATHGRNIANTPNVGT
jgi:hypothetical protein